MLTHLSEHADTFMKSATADVEVFKSGTKAKASAVEDATVAADSSTKGDDKDGPSKWIRSALKGRGAAGSGDEQPSDQTASKERASEAKPQPVDKTPDKPSEAMVTRMVVRPLVGANTRARIKDLLEELPGVQAVKLGPIGDESFEVLVIHPREAKVKDNMLALAPDEIVLKDQKVGYLEIELKDLSWVESGAPA